MSSSSLLRFFLAAAALVRNITADAGVLQEMELLWLATGPDTPPRSTGSAKSQVSEVLWEGAVVVGVICLTAALYRPSKRKASKKIADNKDRVIDVIAGKGGAAGTRSLDSGWRGLLASPASNPQQGSQDRSRRAAGPWKSGGSSSSPTSSADSEISWRARSMVAAPDSNETSSYTLRLAQFVTLNGLDEGCAAMLYKLAAAQAEWVMDQEFLVKVDPAKGTPSAKIVHMVVRANQKSRQIVEAYPAPSDIRKRLADFVDINSIDDRCRIALEALPVAKLRQVMDREFVVTVDPSKGTASAKVAGRVMKARKA